MAARGGNREPDEPTPAVDANRAMVERILQRTARESRTGVMESAVLAAPESPAPAFDALQTLVRPAQPGIDIDSLPGDYSLGTYHGPMRRAQSSGDAESERTPNPVWLDPATTPESILGQARASGRAFTFAVVRLRPQTNPQEFGQARVALGARIEGTSGEYLRVRVPAERGRLESIAGLPGVLGLGALPPG